MSVFLGLVSTMEHRLDRSEAVGLKGSTRGRCVDPRDFPMLKLDLAFAGERRNRSPSSVRLPQAHARPANRAAFS